jgi:hypothetical protein
LEEIASDIELLNASPFARKLFLSVVHQLNRTNISNKVQEKYKTAIEEKLFDIDSFCKVLQEETNDFDLVRLVDFFNILKKSSSEAFTP